MAESWLPFRRACMLTPVSIGALSDPRAMMGSPHGGRGSIATISPHRRLFTIDGPATMTFIPVPSPWNEYASTTFRLAGFGGAGLYLRSTVRPASNREVTVAGSLAELGIGVGLLSPESYFDYAPRPASADLPARLSAFFLSTASDFEPEQSVEALVDEVMGLRIEITSSDAQTVGLLVSLVADLDEPSAEPVALDFETSRTALAQAGHDVRYLNHADGDPGGVSEPPSDWSAS
jgi:hypothetical protein